jgi:hypothetical protein
MSLAFLRAILFFALLSSRGVGDEYDAGLQAAGRAPAGDPYLRVEDAGDAGWLAFPNLGLAPMISSSACNLAANSSRDGSSSSSGVGVGIQSRRAKDSNTSRRLSHDAGPKPPVLPPVTAKALS